ncbi:hypothetical protein CEV32_1939 [Brucella rhizosphaerae]|uniref:Uncharacterized protein n=1 Tax=Brucella rhizosphaerae TaxID=571254 RepID=A0A256F3S1_9HYPH|nr:hypothetical protein CEV32_1939 [Brucella rhizosphaerae]
MYQASDIAFCASVIKPESDNELNLLCFVHFRTISAQSEYRAR